MAGRKERAKRKEKKRKDRAKTKIQARRMETLKKRQEERAEHKKQLAERPKMKPIVNMKKSRDEVLKNLEENARTLQALYDEFLRENQQKRKLNEELEEQGFLTIKEKLEAMNQQAQDDIADAKSKWQAEDAAQEFLEKLKEEKLDSQITPEEAAKMKAKMKTKVSWGGSADVVVTPREAKDVQE